MRRSALLVTVALVLAGCPPEEPPPPPPPPPPQVFLNSARSLVIGQDIPLTTSVSGCADVAQVQLLSNGAFLLDTGFTKSPTAFTVPASLLNNFYFQYGLALPLTFTAKVVCADGRTNTSQPIAITFMPVDQVVGDGSSQMLPDTFVAEGGLGGSPTTFLGCVGGPTGPTLARVDTQGNLLAYVGAMPFNCTALSEITDRSPVTGTRWLMEPGAGVFAFDNMLNVTAVLTGAIKQIGVTRNGDAVVWGDMSLAELFAVLNPNGGTTPIRWSRTGMGAPPGIMMARPVVDEGNRVVWAAMWQFDIGTRVGNVVALKYHYDTGMLLQDPPVALVTQTFQQFNAPIQPFGSFNADGSLFYVSLLGSDSQGNISSTVVACATNTGGCQGAARRWTSVQMGGIVSVVQPFSGGNFVSAAGPYQTWFLSANTGVVQNLGEQPLRPQGSNIVLALQPGVGNEFYVFGGPYVDGVTTWPTEIIATDTPANGELWRLAFGGGDSPVGGMWLAVDEGGLAWLRVGPDLVKPLSNAEYRTARGPSPVP